MTDCKVCELLKDKEKIVYEDEQVVALVGTAALGHVKIIPKKHVKQLHELDENESAQLFKISNISSSIIFELVQAQGTNIMINTLKDHLVVDVLPRKMDDDLNLQWERKPMPDEELSEIEKKIKDKTDYIGVEKPKAALETKPAEEIEEKEGEEEINYLLKQLERIP